MADHDTKAHTIQLEDLTLATGFVTRLFAWIKLYLVLKTCNVATWLYDKSSESRSVCNVALSSKDHTNIVLACSLRDRGVGILEKPRSDSAKPPVTPRIAWNICFWKADHPGA